MQEVHYTESVVRDAARRGILRSIGPLYIAALRFVAEAVLFGVVRGNYDWSIGAFATVLVVGIIVPVVGIRAHTRAALEKFRGLDAGKASLDFSGGRLQIASALGTLDMPLARISKVWRYPEYWILLSGGSIVMTIPLHGVPSSVADAWTHELQTAGITVR